jgi:eukaryotic-like serine/threonine-protein kinase
VNRNHHGAIDQQLPICIVQPDIRKLVVVNVTCDSCQRQTPGPEAVYCMFCGAKLASTSDPATTIDHIPAEPIDRGSMGDGPVMIGGYRILRRLGEGGMGTVFEAEEIESGKRVAMKVLAARLAASQISVERFRQEGRLASQLSHPRCVFVYRADADDGRPFIVMELMPGETLKDTVEIHGRMSAREAIARILDVVEGLIEAHRLGLIHRDVKPSNCFVTADGRVKVGDFGLSKSLSATVDDGQLTNSGAFLGTILYAPPEQIRGEEVRFDSDVYSVTATLFYLLTGRAPYQHESMTAALARAISEPPPRVRDFRPDVPKALDAIIRRGLERDRSRRYSTLEELRDALVQIQPEEQLPARSRMLVAAYLIDLAATAILIQLPVQLIEWLTGMPQGIIIGGELGIDAISMIAYTLYFGIGEGFFGLTLGKWLLNVRVVPIGSVGAPGFGIATLRTTLFHAGFLTLYFGFILLAEWPMVGLFVGLPMIFTSIGYLAYRRRRPDSNRGWHDILTQVQVMQLPRKTHRVRLASRHPNRWDQWQPITNPPFLATGLTLRGELACDRDGRRLWLAEDRSLGRRMIIIATPHTEPAMPPQRPTRLRLITHGEFSWRDQSWHWHGFAAPAGAPLADMIDPKQPLNWADARIIIEQVTEELIAAQSDDEPPVRFGVNQLWVEPGGRVYFIDIALRSSPDETSADRMTLIRETATLVLEGSPRHAGPPIRAPLPSHASVMMRQLFHDRSGYTSLNDFQCELAESHSHAPAVTTAMRAAHLGVTAMLVAFGLAGLLAISQLLSLGVAAVTWLQLRDAKAVAAGILDSDTVARWQQSPRLAEAFNDARLPGLQDRVAELIQMLEARWESDFAALLKIERYTLIRAIEEFHDDGPRHELIAPEPIAGIVSLAMQDRSLGAHNAHRMAMLKAMTLVMAIIIAGYVILAAVFRGGLAYVLSGIVLVRWDGRPAGRVRCGLREMVIWLPLLAILSASMVIQVEWPGWMFGRIIMAVCTVAVFIGYAAVGIRHPERGPHDRLAGTFRVPV